MGRVLEGEYSSLDPAQTVDICSHLMGTQVPRHGLEMCMDPNLSPTGVQYRNILRLLIEPCLTLALFEPWAGETLNGPTLGPQLDTFGMILNGLIGPIAVAHKIDTALQEEMALFIVHQ